MSAKVQERCTGERTPSRDSTTVAAMAYTVNKLTELLDIQQRMVDEVITARRHTLLVLHRLGLSYAEIAGITGLTKPTIAAHIERARRDEDAAAPEKREVIETGRRKSAAVLADVIDHLGVA